jgi:hypothetical protein
MLTDTIKQRLRDYFQSLISTTRATVVNPWAEQESITERISADRVHAIIESAKGGDPRDLFALYRDIIISDNHLQTELNKRKLAVLGDTLTVGPRNKKNPDDVAAAAIVDDMIKDLSADDPQDPSSCSWIRACSHLLDSTMWPVSVVEKVWKPSVKPGLRFELSELVAVPYALLTYVSNSEDMAGALKIRETTEIGYPTGTTNDVDPVKYIVHRGHLLTTHDIWGGPMRSILFWWLLGTMTREWWGRYLERYGSGFLVGHYPKGDDQSRRVLERAFSYAVKIGGLVVSKDTEVEVMQAASSQSAEGYEKFIRLCNEEKSKLVIGQVLSAEARSTGLGSGLGKQHGKVRDDFKEFDARVLAETLVNQLVNPFLKYNALPGRVKLLWGSVGTDEKATLGDFLVALKQAGLEPADEALEGLSEEAGFTLQRAAVAAPLPGGSMALHALSASGHLPADLVDLVAANGAAKLARTFRGSLAPVRRMILLSASPGDLERNIKDFYSDWDPSRVADVVDEALVAFAANGAASVK